MLVTIQSQTHADWSLDPTVPVELRVFALQPYTAAAGTPVSASPARPGTRSRLTWSVGAPCVVTAPPTGSPADTPSSLLIPAVTVESTTDAVSGAGAQLCAMLFRTDTGAALGFYGSFSAFLVPASSATLTWKQIAAAQSTPTGFSLAPFFFLGAWSATTTYLAGNAVSDQGSSWIALVSNTNSEPSATNKNWSLIAQAGAPGSGIVPPYLTAQLVQYSYPNTDGFVFAVIDASGSPIFAVNETGQPLTLGNPILPAGTATNGSTVSFPGSVNVMGDVTLTGTLNDSEFTTIVYPNTEGVVVGFVDALGQLISWYDDSGQSVSGVPVASTAAQNVVVTGDLAPPTNAYRHYYDSVDSSGNKQVAAMPLVAASTAHAAPAEKLLTSAGTNFAATVNADGAVSFISTRTTGGAKRRFKMNADGTNQFFEEFQLTAPQFAAGAPQMHHLPVIGQSLSLGYDAASISTTQPFNNVTFQTNVGESAPPYNGRNYIPNRLINGSAASNLSLIPLTEQTSESPHNGLADSVTSVSRLVLAGNPSGLTSYDILASGSGIANTKYIVMAGPTDVSGGTAAYNEFVTQITQGKAMVTGGYTCPAIPCIHGESDDNATDGPLYYQHLLNWQHDLEAAVKSVTGQTAAVPFLNMQQSSWAAFSGLTRPYTALAQLQTAIDHPDKFICVGPNFIYPRYVSSFVDNYGSGGAHLTGDGSRWMGEMMGKVFKRVFLEGLPWLPFCPLAFTRTNNVVAIDFHVPVGPMVFDTTHVVNPGNYGFEYADDGGIVTITSVQMDPVLANRINVTLSATPTANHRQIRYAYTGVPGSQNAGCGLGPRGCLRDSDATTSYYNSTTTINMLTAGQPYPLWNWCCHFAYAIN